MTRLDLARPTVSINSLFGACMGPWRRPAASYVDLALEPADYLLETKTLPTPGPSMKFKVRVRGRRH